MRAIPTSLQEHLNSGATSLCWCWKLSRADGRVMGFTDHDLAITIDGVVYEPETGMTASEIHENAGLTVDNADLAGVLRSDVITEEDIELGYYDNAVVEVFRVRWDNFSDRVLYKKGTIGQVKRSVNHFVAEFRGIPYKAQVPQGRTYQYDCDAVLGDTRCGANVTGRKFDAIVVGTPTAVTFEMVYVSSPSDPQALAANYFSRGRMLWSTGNSSGKTWEVQSHEIVGDGLRFKIGLWEPSYYLPLVNDRATLFIGCDKKAKTCRDKFTNLINFRGFPSIPGTDLMTKYATKTDANTGTSLKLIG